ncbi:BQ5605_C009g05608 [Microbotryum silenes-dioicae]|uniref:BQ5605_C009g05608 protein n=1 Tax=Microbotryum silenes-dioicae TaxID=796604 RepID=A0A2X0N7D7_9BASI|nr:BQ5605_C009g05608 [Microbotryum silenes-dioicae]
MWSSTTVPRPACSTRRGLTRPNWSWDPLERRPWSRREQSRGSDTSETWASRCLNPSLSSPTTASCALREAETSQVARAVGESHRQLQKDPAAEVGSSTKGGTREVPTGWRPQEEAGCRFAAWVAKRRSW